MKQPKIVLLIFVSGKIVLTGAKVISLDSFFLFCPPRFYMLFWLDLISIVSFWILRWEMRPIQPLRTYTRCLPSSGKTSNGMLHNCDIFVKIHGAGTRLFMLNPTLIYRFHVNVKYNVWGVVWKIEKLWSFILCCILYWVSAHKLVFLTSLVLPSLFSDSVD